MAFSGANKRLSCMKNAEKNLPQELVTEIVSRLPTKHLCPLRFVSKTWFQLLTKDPQFAKLHFDRFMQSNPNPSIIASKCQGKRKENDSYLILAPEFEFCDKALTLEYPFYKHNDKYKLFGDCNGLLCFHNKDQKEVYIWNPIINDHITISCLPVPSSRFSDYCTRTGFGFGFEQDSNVYKVVRFFSETGFTGVSLKTQMQISVYTIGIDSIWRTVEVDVPRHLTPTNWIIPLVNGVLHWHTSGLDYSMSCGVIFTFDLKGEVIGELPPPCGIKFDDILELGGLFCVVDQSDVLEMHIWVMKEYGLVSYWSKQYIIGKPQVCFDNMFPLAFTDKGDIIMDKNSCNLTLYNPETNTVRDLNGFQKAVFLQYAYIGSIISPTAICRAGHNQLEEES